jgi:Ca2+-binding RTX toxin-like protein
VRDNAGAAADQLAVGRSAQQGGHFTNAGLLGAGPAGAAKIEAVNASNADQPLRRFGLATSGNDSLSVRSNGGRSLAPDGGLYGLAGSDRLEGDALGNRLFGSTGNDGLYGRGGGDLLDGGAGNDTLEGGRGDDVLDGGAGNDKLNSGFGIDLLAGAGGNDRITSVDGAHDTIDCGPDNDRLVKDSHDEYRKLPAHRLIGRPLSSRPSPASQTTRRPRRSPRPVR